MLENKTLVCLRPGELSYTTQPVPRLIVDHTILKIKRIGICGTDLHAFGGSQPYFNYPRVLGHELAAEVVATSHPAIFTPGSAVAVMPYLNCGECLSCRSGKTNCCAQMQVFGVHIDGGMATYLQVPTRLLVKAEGLNLDELALLEPLAIAAHGIRRATVQSAEFVLVIGAGPIGLAAMEFARIAGARVIAMDLDSERLSFCREQMQVAETILATDSNVMERLQEITDGNMPEVVIDATGNLSAINGAFSYLAHGGRFVLIGLQKGEISFSQPEFHKREATLMSSRNATKADFDQVVSAIHTGVIKPLKYISHRVDFNNLATEFPKWLEPHQGLIKAMVTF